MQFACLGAHDQVAVDFMHKHRAHLCRHDSIVAVEREHGVAGRTALMGAVSRGKGHRRVGRKQPLCGRGIRPRRTSRRADEQIIRGSRRGLPHHANQGGRAAAVPSGTLTVRRSARVHVSGPVCTGARGHA